MNFHGSSLVLFPTKNILRLRVNGTDAMVKFWLKKVLCMGIANDNVFSRLLCIRAMIIVFICVLPLPLSLYHNMFTKKGDL